MPNFYLLVPYEGEPTFSSSKYLQNERTFATVRYRQSFNKLKSGDCLIILDKLSSGLYEPIEGVINSVPFSLSDSMVIELVGEKMEIVSWGAIKTVISREVLGDAHLPGLRQLTSELYKTAITTFSSTQNKIGTEMNKAYLYIQSEEGRIMATSSGVGARHTLKYEPTQANINQDDLILILYKNSGIYEALLPAISKVISLNRQAKTLTIMVEKVYRRKIPLERVIAVVKSKIAPGFKLLSDAQYQTLLNDLEVEMDAAPDQNLIPNIQPPTVKPPTLPSLSEKEMLDYVKRYIAAKGYYFPEETIYNYHICLKTRPFVILAGLSGTGKSKLSELYAKALGCNTQNNFYLRLAVRPSWNDDRFLLGYLNMITGEYVSVPALDFIRQALDPKIKNNLFFLCLDEMNLAHVEYYFSQFLSAMEETDEMDRRIQLLSISDRERIEQGPNGNSLQIEPFITLPSNLLFTGTINVDETTQQLSDKVIDRANTIEFFEVDLDKIPSDQPMPAQKFITAENWLSFRAAKRDTSYRQKIIEVGNILKKAGLGLGYRVLNDIELYLANSKGLLDLQIAFDLQVKQRILPRLRGSDTKEMKTLLNDLEDFAQTNKLARTGERVKEMQARLERDGYTNFWR